MTFSHYVDKVKLALNKIKKARREAEAYKYIAEVLINCFGFDRATIRKVNWGKETLHLVCYLGFIEEVPSFKLPLSEKSGALGRVALKGEGIVVFDGREGASALSTATSSRSFALIPIKVRGWVRVILEVDRETSGREITPQDKEVLDLFSEMASTILENIINQEELKATLIRDELTGLFNRRYFVERLSEEYERAKRYNIPLSLCIFDIDDFKLLNDTYGHIFGDQVLRQIGRLTQSAVRHADIVSRYGGEEFTVLFTHTALENAVIVAEHMRRAISALIFPYNDKEVHVTATFGISAYSPTNMGKPKELLHKADMALYEGKKQYNKNCIVTYTENGYKKLSTHGVAIAV
jgi:diguanylate cyclase (GGDEF)-like protein